MLTVGTRIYNHGDMANPSHFGTVTRVRADRWGTNYEITPDEGEERQPYWIPAAMISAEFRGHSGTRIVTREAYDRYHETQIAEFRRAATGRC